MRHLCARLRPHVSATFGPHNSPPDRLSIPDISPYFPKCHCSSSPSARRKRSASRLCSNATALPLCWKPNSRPFRHRVPVLHFHFAAKGAQIIRAYTAVVERCLVTGLYVGYVPGLDGAHTTAETLDELNANLAEVVALVLEDDDPPTAETEFVGIQTVRV